jgi:D-alanyl-lipoteichoic acid acyltransferase DltB (MBOAT superfamily)
LATRLTFTQYLDFRLGARGGPQAWFNFFVRPFGARSFAEFWRFWNPVYSYFLLYFVYRPLARVVRVRWRRSRLFGVVVVVSDALHMDLSQWPVWARTTTNLAYLGGCVGAMLFVVIRITG